MSIAEPIALFILEDTCLRLYWAANISEPSKSRKGIRITVPHCKGKRGCLENSQLEIPMPYIPGECDWEQINGIMIAYILHSVYKRTAVCLLVCVQHQQNQNEYQEAVIYQELIM